MTANIVKTWIAEKAEAREEGIEQGIEKGMHLKEIELAKNFLLLGTSIELVAKGTQLSIEEVQKLKEELDV